MSPSGLSQRSSDPWGRDAASRTREGQWIDATSPVLPPSSLLTWLPTSWLLRPGRFANGATQAGLPQVGRRGWKVGMGRQMEDSGTEA